MYDLVASSGGFEDYNTMTSPSLSKGEDCCETHKNGNALSGTSSGLLWKHGESLVNDASFYFFNVRIICYRPLLTLVI